MHVQRGSVILFCYKAVLFLASTYITCISHITMHNMLKAVYSAVLSNLISFITAFYL